jgi:hypothetical protein
LAGEALAAAGNYAELLTLFGADGSLVTTERDRSLALIASVRTSAEGEIARVQSYFLDGSVGSEHRKTYRELKAFAGEHLTDRDELATLGRLFIYDRSYGDALYFFAARFREVLPISSRAASSWEIWAKPFCMAGAARKAPSSFWNGSARSGPAGRGVQRRRGERRAFPSALLRRPDEASGGGCGGRRPPLYYRPSVGSGRGPT